MIRDRHPRDGQRNTEQGREQRAGPNFNRRSVKDDSDLWSNVRQSRPPGPDDSERTYRKNRDRGHDRDGPGDRDSGPISNFENHRRDRDAEADGEPRLRRTGIERGRNEPSRYRDGSLPEIGGPEDPESTKTREWRDKEKRGTRGSDREWTRGAKADLDPEWMEAPVSENANGTHTQEDFERWKERMKSGNAVKPEVVESRRTSHNHTSSSVGLGTAKVKVDTPLVVDSSVDGFFGLWNQSQKKETPDDVVDGAQAGLSKPGASKPKPSKFTGFFNPKPELDSKTESLSRPSLVTGTDSSNEDREGFQRILNLLGQQQQPPNRKPETPPRAQQQREFIASPPVHVSRSMENNDVHSLLGTSSPSANPMPHGKDSEFLLKLMQQPQQHRPDVSQANIESHHTNQAAIPGPLPLSNLMISPQEKPQQTTPAQPLSVFFDDASAKDKLNPNTERKGPPPGFFDNNFIRQSPSGIPQQSPFPLGLQRPPGLDQVPTNYPQHVQPPRQNMLPPPGFQMATRNQNPFPPGLLLNERLQFGTPANGRAMPPPGFMQGAPPGFPVPFSPETMPFGGFSEGGSFGQGFPAGQQRR